MKFKYLLLNVSVLLSLVSVSAQVYIVESFDIVPNDLTARTKGRVDNNGRKCGMIKVYVKDAITVTDGPVIGDVIDRGMEKWVYVAHDTKQIELLFKEHMPLRVTFDDYNFTTLSSNMTYVMKLKEVKDTIPSLAATMLVQEQVTPPSKQTPSFTSTKQTASEQHSIPNLILDSSTSLDQLDPVIRNLINNMVYIEGGSFMMGATDSESPKNEKPVHQETVESFSIGKYEVTQKEWMAVMGTNPSSVKGDNLPVFDVSWNECQEFIRKLNLLTGMNFRLPTEEEWEYASRGGNRSNGYKYSGSDEISDVAWYDGNSKKQIPGSTVFDILASRRKEIEFFAALTSYIKHQDRIRGSVHNVGTKEPNELGLHDMSGSVCEWTSSNWNDNYKKPRNSTQFVMRGGSWLDSPYFCRVSYRLGHEPQNAPLGSVFLVGLRLAL